jgi:hypothetical protein
MPKDIYRDTVSQLKHPITIPDKKAISSLRHAATQEIIWAREAKSEYNSELNRAMNLPKGPLRNELLWDSRVALDFYKIRKARASHMLVEADKLEKSLRR